MSNANLQQTDQTGQDQPGTGDTRGNATDQGGSDLLSIVERFRGVRVLVIGDVMLDIYRIGDATRISPEAPVPVLLNPSTEYRLGGAASVAAMCAALGADVSLVGIVGNDPNGERLVSMLVAVGITWRGITDRMRRTTTKERICAVASGRHRQQLGRLDTEDTDPLDARVLAQLGGTTTSAMRECPQIVLVSDYAKGVCEKGIAGIPLPWSVETIVDPPRGGDWRKYNGAACMVPNREEAAGFKTPKHICESFNLDACVIKQDEDGCILQDDIIPMTRKIPARGRAVHDVTGAGDEFLAVLGLARAVGASWYKSATLANTAAGLQVERHGCDPVTLPDLRQALQNPPCK